MKKFIQNLVFILALFVFFTILLSKIPSQRERLLSLSEIVEKINKGEVEKITVAGNSLEILLKNGTIGRAKKEPESSLSESLINLGVEKEKLKLVNIEIKEIESIWSFIGPFLFSFLPTLLLFFLLWSMFRQAKTGASQIFDFTKARAKILGPGGQLKEKVTFEDVGGLKEAKEELKEIVDFLKNPKKYLQLGAKIPRGVLLIGAPGTGKTLLAKAIASQANVPFFSITASEVIELFVGVGASRIRNLFEQARKAGRAIIFIDEIDSIGKIRGIGFTGGHEEREQTLNQLLAEMDGIGREENLIVIGATNKPEQLDPALLRPGRFDRRIVLDLPDVQEREEILKIHCRGKPLSLDCNLKEIAERTPGFSGADLANLVNEAAILAARKNKTQISQQELIEAIEKVLLGPERKSHLLTPEEKKITAFHEVGHALVSSFLERGEPVRKISIIARGLAAGYTLKTPEKERKIKTKTEFLAEIATLLGGYCAEKIIFGEVSSGAANDLERATQLARKLVLEYGMSSLGPVVFGKKEELVFLGYEEILKNYSEEMAAKIDKEIEKIIKEAEKKATEILLKNKNRLIKIANILIKKETIEKEEFEQLLGKIKKIKIKIN